MPLWVPIVQCWITTGTPPWPARYGLLDAPGGAQWLERWRVLSTKLARADAKQISRLFGNRSPVHDRADGTF